MVAKIQEKIAYLAKLKITQVNRQSLTDQIQDEKTKLIVANDVLVFVNFLKNFGLTSYRQNKKHFQEEIFQSKVRHETIIYSSYYSFMS